MQQLRLLCSSTSFFAGIIKIITEEKEQVGRTQAKDDLRSRRGSIFAFKVLPETVPEQKALLDLWLAMGEIKAKVVVTQMELPLEPGKIGMKLQIFFMK